MRVHFTAWGRGIAALKIPAYAMRRGDGISAAFDVVDAIARANGLAAASARQDGINGDGEPIYQATLGKRCRGGGVAPAAQIWFRITGMGRP